MGPVVYVMLLASCFATGLALRCYECIGGNALPSSISDHHPIPVSDDCSPSTFNSSSITVVTVTDPGILSNSVLLSPAYCIKLVANFGDSREMTIRGYLQRSDVMGIHGHDVPALPPSASPSPIPFLLSLVLTTAQDPASHAAMTLCNRDLCNSCPEVGGAASIVTAAALVAMMGNRLVRV